MFLFGNKEPGETAIGEGRMAKGSGSARSYGIDQAIALMRGLPVDDNVELVVQVMRQTLESLNVRLSGIVDDAQAKEVALQERVEKLDVEIESLAEQIDLRRQEISRLTADLRETGIVKERLLLAQKMERGSEEDGVPVVHPPKALPPPRPPIPGRGAETRAAAGR
jgi:DNA-binding transcriptional ArsR family regulator